jgi:hypothetical protein
MIDPRHPRRDRGFAGYLGGGRTQGPQDGPSFAGLAGWRMQGSIGYPRAMLEFRPADEFCPADCAICGRPRPRRQRGGATRGGIP